MEWTILDSDVTKQDPTGIEGFISRLDRELRGSGPPLEGFRFLNSGLEMLRITREIEEEVRVRGAGSTLYVGFQTAEKLAKELGRYRRLRLAGVQTVAFGQGDLPEEDAEVLEQWVDLSADTGAFQNQWYLVSLQPTPIVFIGWETSSPQMFGHGGISAPGKEFKGFVSSDRRVVDAVIGHLERVRRQHGPSRRMPVDELAREVRFPLRRVMVLTDDGKDRHLAAMRDDAARLALMRSSSVVLYDLAAASYLVSPYPSDEYERDWLRALDKRELGMVQRRYLVEQLEKLEARGITARAVLPTSHGFGHLAQWAQRENVDLIMIPSSLVYPGLVDRIKGYSLKSLLASTDVPVLVYGEGGTVWLETRNNSSAARRGSAAGLSDPGKGAIPLSPAASTSTPGT